MKWLMVFDVSCPFSAAEMSCNMPRLRRCFCKCNRFTKISPPSFSLVASCCFSSGNKSVWNMAVGDEPKATAAFAPRCIPNHVSNVAARGPSVRTKWLSTRSAALKTSSRGCPSFVRSEGMTTTCKLCKSIFSSASGCSFTIPPCVVATARRAAKPQRNLSMPCCTPASTPGELMIKSECKSKGCSKAAGKTFGALSGWSPPALVC
mmetsp:Transcript_36211/g.83188  ORF Transcript_36211/g.83188 Transcript_36211/m.83188 type:complete len:206 (-) Transcript_36211:2030-2647(-)